jgi:hypothetical protein
MENFDGPLQLPRMKKPIRWKDRLFIFRVTVMRAKAGRDFVNLPSRLNPSSL